MESKKYLVLIYCVLFNVVGFSQEKGVSPNEEKSSFNKGNTYAVVVGISDYQDPRIPDLRFADKDAEAFAQFLRSDVGGNLDNDHLRLLLNSKASMGQFANALDWLMEVAKENDLVFIYFSGHGDVEKKTLSQPGYLLCWDAPSSVYLGGGALALLMFQDVISTLSIQNKVKVVVISDACHSGKLSGSAINGTQATSANLAKQFANEVKILSCQANEYSIEGVQWGGGRGVFSYHLVEGLSGLADLNKDQVVSAFEIGRYLEDHVSAEVAPISQLPVVSGDKSDKLSKVSPGQLELLKNSKNNSNQIFAATESKGFEDQILATIDSFTKTTYKLFNQSLINKNFFPDTQKLDETANACSEYYYSILIKDKRISALHSTIKRNFAAALIDDSQQIINKFMKAEIHEISLSQINKIKKYSLYPRELDKASELLGDQHYLYKVLQARKYYFEGFRYVYGGDYNVDVYKKGLSLMLQSLSWQPDMPLSLLGVSYVYGYLLPDLDSSIYYANLANGLAPNWILPFVRCSEALSTTFMNFEKSIEFIEKVKKIDPENPLVWEAEANYYFDNKQFQEAKLALEKIVANQPSSVCLPCSKNLLIQMYIESKNFKLAEQMAKNMIQSDTTNYATHINIGKIYTLTNRVELAKLEFRAVSVLTAANSNQEAIYNYWLAYIYMNQNDFHKAFSFFEQSIKQGNNDYSWINIDPDIALLRNQKEDWNSLMKKYFPDKFKDK